VNNERALQESRIIVRTREITLIQTMTTMLNATYTLDDAAIVLLNIMPKLLPSLSGAIFLLDENNSLNEVSHWGVDWHHDIATMTKNRWLLHKPNSYECHSSNDHIPSDNFCVDLFHDGEFIGILQLVSEEKMINEQYQSLTKNLAPQLSSALTNIQLKDLLRNQAIRDPLTELYNRRFMLEAFEQALNRAERHKSCLAVLMIDLDHFKKFNDTHGHEAGDKVLEVVAEQFKQNLRLEDIACRYGGEEFCILCPDTGLKDAHILAEKLRHCVAEQKITYQTQELDRVTLSIGISIYPNHGHSSNELIQKADKALYNAKEQGRNCTAVTRIKVPYYQE
jgi:diguanylate cyclase (GGDEF)-like protein